MPQTSLRSTALLAMCFWVAGMPAMASTPYHDPSPVRTLMVPVDRDVSLEVLDWGGTGRPVVLLAGLGDTAHVFDRFAPLLTAHYHVYGITRRGFGSSSHPSRGYGVARLGEDVVAVIDALHLQRPVLAGHSIAGEELSWIANNAPSEAAGLVYLDAAQAYAFYSPLLPDLDNDIPTLQAALGRVLTASDAEKPQMIDRLLNRNFPRVEQELRDRKEAIEAAPKASIAPTAADKKSVAAFEAWTAQVAGAPIPEGEVHAVVQVHADGSIGERIADPAVYKQIMDGGERFTRIPAPLLALYACPHRLTAAPGESSSALATREELDRRDCQAQALELGVPDARVVLLPDVFHAMFLDRPEEVAGEMDAFIRKLPR